MSLWHALTTNVDTGNCGAAANSRSLLKNRHQAQHQQGRADRRNHQPRTFWHSLQQFDGVVLCHVNSCGVNAGHQAVGHCHGKPLIAGDRRSPRGTGPYVTLMGRNGMRTLATAEDTMTPATR